MKSRRVRASKRSGSLRTPKFAKAEIQHLNHHWSIVDARIVSAVRSNLNARAALNYLQSDDDIFIPYIDAYVLGTLRYRFSSVYTELGNTC